MGRAITILEQGKFPTRHTPITILRLPTLHTKGDLYSIWNTDGDEVQWGELEFTMIANKQLINKQEELNVQ